MFRMGATNMSILCVQLHEYLLLIIHEKVASLEPQYHSQKSETQPRGLAVPCQGSSIIEEYQAEATKWVRVKLINFQKKS